MTPPLLHRSDATHESAYEALAYDYAFPEELIAQAPPARREDARLLVVDRVSGTLRDEAVPALPSLLAPGDLLVLNDTRVIKARVDARRADTGGRAEVLVVEAAEGVADAMIRMRGRAAPGVRLVSDADEDRLEAILEAPLDGGVWRIETGRSRAALLAWLERFGRVPLPPYVRRGRGGDARDAMDAERYQTVFAARAGAVAAPTAGLHFSPELLDELARRDIRSARITLHVGPGTFRPVKSDDIREHAMHSERFEVSEGCAEAIRETRAAGRRVVAVGTTVVRALESAAAQGALRPAAGSTNLFIHPPYRFQAVDALFTNFHAPRTTLLMLTAAFGGRRLVLDAYAHAVESRYRLLSYGDAMLIL